MSQGPTLLKGLIEALLASALMLAIYLILRPAPLILAALGFILGALVIARNAR